MTTWAEQIRAGNLTVKGRRANTHQAQMMAMIATRTRAKGGDLVSAAGAIATAIQESTVTNLNRGDRDSLGLFQQRPSMNWGTPAQVTTPTYAIDKFLSIYLPYRARGMGWLEASHRTQRSARPHGPLPWYPEAHRAAKFFLGGMSGPAADGSRPVLGETTNETRTITRDKAYEFSRGSADGQPEDSFAALGRLATEVGSTRFMRRGTLWFVAEEWLENQRPRYRWSEGARGVLSIEHTFETRRNAAEATVRVVLGRYAVAPGDRVALQGEGPGDGGWLVSGVRRQDNKPVLEVSLKRAQPRLLEPAPEQEQIQVGGSSIALGSRVDRANPDMGAAAPEKARRAYEAACAMTSWRIPYSQARRNLIPRPTSADCSSSVSWVLWQAGIALPAGVAAGGWAPVSGSFVNWGEPGPGRYFTIYTHGGHIWIRWNGIGSAWRFDTSSYGDPGGGPRNRSTSRPTAGFVVRHAPGC